MNTSELIAAIAFAIIFLSALFLFIRNYPSDRWFSVVFVVAGGVLVWGSQITTTTTTDTDNKLYSSTTI